MVDLSTNQLRSLIFPRLFFFVLVIICLFCITGRENTGGFRPVLLPGWILFFLASLLASDHSGLLKKRR
jgi:hypothetical protein